MTCIFNAISKHLRKNPDLGNRNRDVNKEKIFLNHFSLTFFLFSGPFCSKFNIINYIFSVRIYFTAAQCQFLYQELCQFVTKIKKK